MGACPLPFARYLTSMSANARRKAHPEAHQAERHIAQTPARAWAGRACISTDDGVLEIPGTWHLDLPGEGRPLRRHARASFPVPAPGDLEAWREHLVQLVTLQVPGMQLRVRTADSGGWQLLEVGAPTTPASVVHIDREGLAAVLGQGASISLSIDTRNP
jgi:hypothetical protein